MANRGSPHRMVDDVLDGAVGAIRGFGHSINAGLQGAGRQVQSALDKPLEAVGGPRLQPLRIVDSVLSGTLNGVERFASDGVLGGLQTGAEGIQSGLDQPVQEFGIPPPLGEGMGGGMGSFPSFPLTDFKFPEPPMLR